tara:strand:+ start:11903 stop:12625 length:723 start_codon:yes stop_codon:yes gene_type:complete
MLRSTARNREQSALLRLPGELRNNTYEHLLGGLVIRVHDAADAGTLTKCRLMACKANGVRTTSQQLVDYLAPMFALATLCQILFASRQLHTETHDLPFKLNKFSFLKGNKEVTALSQMLRPAQLALIAEIEIPWIDVVLGAAVLSYNEARLADNPSHATSWAQSGSSLLPKPIELDVFKGLKHVLISGCPERNSRWCFRKVERAVRCRAGKDDVEVECRVDRSAYNEFKRLREQRAQSSA